jgi:hypothetical protein
MATFTNSIVTTRLTTISRPNEYLGNVKAIPVSFAGTGFGAGDTLVFSEVMPQNCKVIAVHLTNAAMGGTASLDIGYTGTPNAILNDATVVSAGTVNYQGVPVDVSEKQIIGTVNTNWDDGALTGYILVVTDQ